MSRYIAHGRMFHTATEAADYREAVRRRPIPPPCHCGICGQDGATMNDSRTGVPVHSRCWEAKENLK